MNKVKRLARKRMYQQTFNNTEIAEQLSDTRKLNVVLTQAEKEAGHTLEGKTRNQARILSLTTPKDCQTLTFNELRRRAKAGE